MIANKPTDEALLSIWLEIPGNGDMYADIAAFARAVLAEHGASPVNDNAACGAQNAIHAPQEAWLREMTRLVLDYGDIEASESKRSEYALDAYKAVMTHARRRITGD
ncbi:hypothetical protein [Pusillimonas sp. ANT_WB101]|uniref:hypothetical protein n=1 Tax=Pusillimonas sp. ANT_WB101 TaxID=2597356 RepID=UPI0011ED21C3|nr:hypothetical protein [Pusillimonas sp. ANT_WB101]KAA0910635.1 hypothetical protein FQ179_01800 [Pusillimonas sp. ANT_WB101]